MLTFLFTFAVVLAAVAAMAIGVLCGRRAIRGSCGGASPDGACQRCGKPQ